MLYEISVLGGRHYLEEENSDWAVEDIFTEREDAEYYLYDKIRTLGIEKVAWNWDSDVANDFLPAPAEDDITLAFRCPLCQHAHSLNVNAVSYLSWQNGTNIHVVLPQLTAMQRTQITKHLCPKCYTTLHTSS